MYFENSLTYYKPPEQAFEHGRRWVIHWKWGLFETILAFLLSPTILGHPSHPGIAHCGLKTSSLSNSMTTDWVHLASFFAF